MKDPALIARPTRTALTPNAAIDPRAVEELQEYFLRLGTQQQRVPVERVTDTSYLQYAPARLGRVD